LRLPIALRRQSAKRIEISSRFSRTNTSTDCSREIVDASPMVSSPNHEELVLRQRYRTQRYNGTVRCFHAAAARGAPPSIRWSDAVVVSPTAWSACRDFHHGPAGRMPKSMRWPKPARARAARLLLHAGALAAPGTHCPAHPIVDAGVRRVGAASRSRIPGPRARLSFLRSAACRWRVVLASDTASANQPFFHPYARGRPSLARRQPAATGASRRRPAGGRSSHRSLPTVTSSAFARKWIPSASARHESFPMTPS